MLDMYKPATLLALLILGGCSIAEDGLWPATADRGAAQADFTPMAAPGAAAQTAWEEPIAPAESLVLDLPARQEATETGTFVGKKTAALRTDLNLLIAVVTSQNDALRAIRGSTAQLSQRYQSSVSEIQARLDAGTAPGNPELMARVQSAQDALDQMAGTDSRLTELSARVAGNADLARYITESATNATGLQGSAEEDRRQLAAIIDDTAQVMTANDRLLTEINATMARNNAMAMTEQANLSGLAMAVRNGNAYTATRSWMATASGGSALMVIGFDRADTEYESALRDAISATLDRQPDAHFELIAVTPQRGGTGEDAKRNTERVFRSLINMGLPTDRVILISETSDLVAEGEVQVYVR